MFARAVTIVGAAGLTAVGCCSLHNHVLEEAGPSLISDYLTKHVSARTKPALQPKPDDIAVNKVRITAYRVLFLWSCIPRVNVKAYLYLW